MQNNPRHYLAPTFFEIKIKNSPIMELAELSARTFIEE
jgi:hypothetical protein